MATPYKKSEIYFMIDLYDEAEKFNRLMYVTIGVGVLKSEFKLVKKTAD
jgi:hypothetical protein